MAQTKQNDAANFGQKLAELEQLTSWFESDNLDLDAGLAKFERGMELVAELRADLAKAENKIENIKAQFGSSTNDQWGEPEIGIKKTDRSDSSNSGTLGLF